MKPSRVWFKIPHSEVDQIIDHVGELDQCNAAAIVPCLPVGTSVLQTIKSKLD